MRPCSGGIGETTGLRHDERVMPRYVVTLWPPADAVVDETDRAERAAITARLSERFRPRVRPDGGLEFDFSKRSNLRAAKEAVAAELDRIRINPEWRRLFVLFPTEDALRGKGF